MCAISRVRTAGPFSAQSEQLSYCELDPDGLGLCYRVHSMKGAPIELKMAPAVPKRKIAQLLKISAQSEQLCESFTLNA